MLINTYREKEEEGIKSTLDCGDFLLNIVMEVERRRNKGEGDIRKYRIIRVRASEKSVSVERATTSGVAPSF